MVEDVKEMIILKENLMRSIHEARNEIADLKEKKMIKKSHAWLDAQGTAKEKEDYVKSEVASIDSEILRYEADIELYYNHIIILNDKMDLEILNE